MSCKVCEDYLSSYPIWYYREMPGWNAHERSTFCPMCGEPLTPPKPLTLEQLREMTNTDWVWLVFPELSTEENGWARALRIYQIYSHEHYGKSWLAYTHKPKEDGK